MEVSSWEIINNKVPNKGNLNIINKVLTFISALTWISYWIQGMTGREILSRITSRPDTGCETPAGNNEFGSH